MATLLERVLGHPAHIVGISLGGALALQMALDDPSLVQKLVLVNTFARLRPESPGIWLYFAMRSILAHTLGMPIQARAVARHIFPQAAHANLRAILYGQIVQADPRSYRATMRALARFDALPRLNEVRQSTLVITGDRDTTVPPACQRILAAGIPFARQSIIPNAGHAVIAEQPEAFNRILLEFLTG
jgi:pimeloyl-ACP methyl ester carboxylesterase